jgi:hypothetical protein
MVAFMALILLAGTLAIYFINRELENRILHEADEFNQDITLATDLVFRSLSEGEFLYDLVEQKTTAGLTVGRRARSGTLSSRTWTARSSTAPIIAISDDPCSRQLATFHPSGEATSCWTRTRR